MLLRIDGKYRIIENTRRNVEIIFDLNTFCLFRVTKRNKQIKSGQEKKISYIRL